MTQPPVLYNKNVKYALLAALALTLAACSKNIDTLDAVKQGVIRDIPKDINLGGMDVNVVSVSFRGKEADAIVTFAPKGGPPMMNMKYVMERKADEWHIKTRTSGATEHAGAADPTQGGAPGAAPQAMPPGHPATPGAGAMPQGEAPKGAELPSGHPALGDVKK